MGALFLKLVNLSITASWLVAAVITLRIIFKKAPKWIFCALWGSVALRLICPFSVESALSLIPSFETIPPAIITSSTPAIDSGIDTVDSIVNPIISFSLAPDPTASATPAQILIFVLSCGWLIGMAAMQIYAITSFAVLKHRVSTATPLCKNIKQCETVSSPFVLGLFRPVIYLPYSISETDIEYVTAHEQAHIRRKDHWWKPLGFIILSVYWFNPIIWVAYILLCRDIEAACDEKVISGGDKDYLKAYSSALLNCSVHRRTIAACPLAFGETGVKSRIKNVMSYKKPAFWIITVALVASVIAAVCLLTVPKEQNEHDTSPLYYKNTLSAITDYDAVQVIHYPVTEDVKSAKILLGISYCDELTEYLETAEWTECRPPRDNPASPGSIEFIIEEEYRVTIYKKPRIAKVRYFDEVRWYRTHDRNAYDNAVAIAQPSDLSSSLALTLRSYAVSDVVYEDGRYSFSIVAGKNAPEFALTGNMQLYTKNSSSDNFGKALGTMKKFELTKENFDNLFESSDGWHTNSSAAKLRQENETAYQLLYNEDTLYYLLQQKNGDLYITYAHYFDTQSSQHTHIRWMMKLADAMTEYTDIVAVSGENSVPVLVCHTMLTTDIMNQLKSTLHWLEIAPSESEFLPFSLFSDGDELSGRYSIYDAETFEKLDFFEPSGLSQHTYIFQNAEYGKDYIITMAPAILSENLSNYIYVFGARLSEPDTQSGNTENTLDTAISQAILEHYADDKPTGLLHVEAHKLLGKEELSGTPIKGSSNHTTRETVYLMVLHQKYSFYEDTLKEVGGSYIPTAITFDVDENGEYTLTEYWEPRDGAYHAKDIRSKFPETAAEAALNNQDYIDELQDEVQKKAYDYLYSNGNARDSIADLFETLCTNVENSKLSPEDYIAKHTSMYKELVGYGEFTLRYCFEEFVHGEKDKTKTTLMALVCQKISAEMGEALLVNWADPQTKNGTDWFRELQENAKELQKQYEPEHIAKSFPVSYIFLQVMDENIND